jgi:hypothetical protein
MRYQSMGGEQKGRISGSLTLAIASGRLELLLAKHPCERNPQFQTATHLDCSTYATKKRAGAAVSPVLVRLEE